MKENKYLYIQINDPVANKWLILKRSLWNRSNSQLSINLMLRYFYNKICKVCQTKLINKNRKYYLFFLLIYNRDASDIWTNQFTVRCNHSGRWFIILHIRKNSSFLGAIAARQRNGTESKHRSIDVHFIAAIDSRQQISYDTF